MIKISQEMVKKAFLILKDHAFNESYNLYLKKKVAEFEFDILTEIDKSKNTIKIKGIGELSINSSDDILKSRDYLRLNLYFKEFSEWINDKDFLTSDRFLSMLEEIEVKYLPKTYKEEKNENQLNYFTNVKSKDSYHPKDCNYIIDAPIDLHIIDNLWSLLIGNNIDKVLSNNVYGNRLTEMSKDFLKNHDMDKSSNHMFKYYFRQYTEWRNGAISSASDISKKHENVAILALDIKSFYYNLDIDMSKIPHGFFGLLHEALNKILIRFSEILQPIHNTEENEIRTALPIGFSSSAIIANYTLKIFDQRVLSDVRPSYYGRYVDDLLFVFKDPIIENDQPTLKFISRYFKDLLSFDNNNGYTISNEGSINKKYFSVQERKIVLQYFDKDNSKAGLNFLKKELQSRTSIVSFSEDHLADDLDIFSYKALYNDDENDRLKNLVGLVEDNSGFSNFINSHISARKLCKNGYSKDIFNKIKYLFKGVNILKLSKYWEKVYEYLIVNNRISEVNEFYKLVDKEIKSIEVESGDILNSLTEYNDIAYSLASAINHIDLSGINLSVKLRVSNLFNHKLVSWPLINYTEYSGRLLDSEEVLKISSLKICKNKLEYSPRFIHFDEFQIFSFLELINGYSKGSLNDSLDLQSWLTDCMHSYPNTFALKGININESLIETGSNKIGSIKIGYNNTRGKVAIGIANLQVSEKDIVDNIKEGFQPNISIERFKDLNKILNDAKLQDCDLLVLPEVSIPILWLPYVISYSRMNQIGIIFGLEHWVSNDIVYNFMIESLPFIEKNNIKQNLFTTRLKNHYAPKELQLISEMFLKTPDVKSGNRDFSYYHKVEWRGVSFATYNCYELADINHRAIFKNEIDLLVASVFNADTNYYDHIMESVVRDLHCYVVQVNTSQYGGSCVLRPSKTYMKKMLYLKGGENSCTIKTTIDINALRDFQFSRTGLTSSHSTNFKGVPPGFDHNKSRSRGRS